MIRRLVSGGQTGVDRGALDAAIAAGIEHGGWCPLGRRAEDGAIPEEYRLAEVESVEYPVRTERNVVDSDGTLILYRQKLVGGTALTRKLARRHGKPFFLQDLVEPADFVAVHIWIEEHTVHVLNVAGPRESTAPGIQSEAYEFLRQLLTSDLEA